MQLCRYAAIHWIIGQTNEVKEQVYIVGELEVYIYMQDFYSAI